MAWYFPWLKRQEYSRLQQLESQKSLQDVERAPAKTDNRTEFRVFFTCTFVLNLAVLWVVVILLFQKASIRSREGTLLNTPVPPGN